MEFYSIIVIKIYIFKVYLKFHVCQEIIVCEITIKPLFNQNKICFQSFTGEI